MSLTTPASTAKGREALRNLRVESILTTLLARSPLARTELAALTGYSPSTVTGIIQDLTDAGYVREVGHEQSTGGRRRTLIEFDRSSMTIAVITVGGRKIKATLIDLNAKIVDQIEQNFTPLDPIASASKAVSVVVARASIRPSRVVLALPGVVDSDGSVTLAPSFGAVPRLALADALSTSIGIPVIVENDVNLIALGERVDGAGAGVDDLVLIHIGEGIGATIIIGGRVLDGSSRSAGEIGFLPQSMNSASDGERGQFEKKWSAPGIEFAAQQVGITAVSSDLIAELCSDKSDVARTLLEDTLNAWAFAAIVCVCVVNPNRVIFSGHAENLDESARQLLRDRVRAGAPSPTDVEFAV
ncbi:ROK family transcriptional regulator, partial [Cryobacterium sp. MLB-32]|uniref:ROK family transcriptional regulator n=1 Tax=Cryobacterium sp. MLB-32 TaxID=1529318 RepID=UPI00056D6C85